MPYSLTHFNGNILGQTGTVADGQLDSSTNLSLPGPNYVGYGQKLNENLIYLLENFASGSTFAPNKPVVGQLWYDTTNQILNVYTVDQVWSSVNGITPSQSQPATAVSGDIWFNQNTNQMFLFDDGRFKLIGPIYTKAMGVSGAVPVIINDANSAGTTHNVLQLQFGDTVIATFSADAYFTPTPPIPGFPIIRQGLTLNNTLNTTSLNTNVVGSFTGPLTGDVVGNVIATTLTGALTGPVVGDVVGNITATTLTGSLTGNVVSTSAYISNLSSPNVIIAGGNITSITNLTATNGTFTNLQATTLLPTNFSTANAQITNGNITGITNATATNLTATNLVSGNVKLTAGTITGITDAATVTLVSTHFSTSNIQATGGNITNIQNLAAITTVSTHFSTSNAQITGGNITGINNSTATTLNATNLSTGNARITGGNIVSTPIWNANITNANVQNSVTTTPSTNDRSTALATTAFVHNVLPTGAIIMWGGATNTIPAGWVLCNGQNGTPDLRDRFIVGAGNSYAVGATGGNASTTLSTSNLPAHTHSVSLSGTTASAGGHLHSATSTVNDPGHNHSVTDLDVASGYGLYSNSLYAGYTPSATTETTSTAQTGVSVSTSIAAVTDHTHSVSLTGTTGSIGSAASIDNRPPFYALCFIQKTY